VALAMPVLGLVTPNAHVARGMPARGLVNSGAHMAFGLHALGVSHARAPLGDTWRKGHGTRPGVPKSQDSKYYYLF